MTPEHAVDALHNLHLCHDPEEAHARADEIILATLPTDLWVAYLRAQERAAWSVKPL